MHFTFSHNNLNVLNLDKSIEFYGQAFGLKVLDVKLAPDNSFKLVFLTDGVTSHTLELTWLRDKAESYNLGDNEFHLCLEVEDYSAAHALHTEMGCICFENEAMGIYFVQDPDGYWIEVVPRKMAFS